MNNFLTRTLTGTLFVIVLISGIWFSKESFLVLCLAIIITGIWEFYSITSIDEIKPQKYLGTLIAACFFVSNYLYSIKLFNGKIFLPFLLLFICIFITELYRKHRQPFTNIAFTLLGIVWIAIPVSLLNYIVFYPAPGCVYNPKILLGFFFLMWANDTGSYLVGITIGKHRLFERISPKKSWEGSIGGLIATLGISYLIARFFTELGVTDWLIIALIVVVFGTFGDLAESLLKRSINIKDSGKILPGHGGILDRFDSVFLAIPCLYAYLELIK